MSKKAYMNLLKEAISEFDTTPSTDVKGPFLDSILKWRGDGELTTNKDAGSILERYYFNEDQDPEIKDIHTEADYEDDKGAKGKGMKHAQGSAGPQAGTSDKATIKAAKKEIEDEIATEMEEIEGLELTEDEKSFLEAEDLLEGEEKEGEDEEDNEDDEAVTEELEMENAIIEKLIAEMEADDDAQGTNGTQQAGTGDADKLVPDRKDDADKAVKAKKYNEENAMIDEALQELELEMAAEEGEGEEESEEEEELDVDKEIKKEAASAVPGGPSPKKTGEDYEEDEAAYSEAFEIFKEAIEED